MKKKIEAFFRRNAGRTFKAKEIAKTLDIFEPHEFSSLKAMLHKLCETGFLKKEGKKYGLKIPEMKTTESAASSNAIPSSNRIVGTLEVNQGGYGFVTPKNLNIKDIFIASRNLGTAFNGDIVEVTLFAKQKGKNIEGQVVKVLERKREEFVGTLEKSKFFFLRPDDPNIQRDIYIDGDHLNGAKKGDKIIVGNIRWDTSKLNPEGEVIEVLGKAGSQDAEILSIAVDFDIPYKFSSGAINEAGEINSDISKEEIKGRVDFRSKNVITIDPEDAKDFDDALSIESLKNGNFLVGIHIADVGNYIKSGSSLDSEALKRGNSVYLVGKVIPMLPEKLSNDICSLVPNEDRLTYSVLAELTKRGKVASYQIKKTIINSKRRFTYEQVQEIIQSLPGTTSKKSPKRKNSDADDEFLEDIKNLNNLAQVLRKKRMREGSIEFWTSEVRFELDENGKPIQIIKKDIKQSNMLVEEFMLLANRICARHVGAPKAGDAKLFVYRIHDLPDKEKVFEFAKFVKSLGYSFDPNASSRSNQFQLLMQQVKGAEEESLINELAIRSMAKAVYSPKNIGHYGLGFNYYTHFTSPIRRYSDLLAHRLLDNYINKKSGAKYSFKSLDDISAHISQTERNAIDAERFSVKTKQIEYLKDHIGEEFHAIISGITHFGMFVKIIDILAEGLIRLRDLEGDFYIYDEKKYSLIGRRSKKTYRLGDKIMVKLVRVDQEKSELDFIIVES